MALKLLEGDEEITSIKRRRLEGALWEEVYRILRRREDAILAAVGGRYECIVRLVRAVVARPRARYTTLTERVDHYATHPLWGLLILPCILGLVFWLTYSVGAPLQESLDTYLIQTGARALRSILSGAPGWLCELLAEGVIGGAGMVLTFLPILIIFLAALAFLEDTGYMARAACVMDRFMHVMGLHGKSFLPLFLGFGCNVPAVMGARIVDSPRARLLTILIAPLVPCKARTAVVRVLTPIFFGQNAALVTRRLIGLSLALLAVTGWLLHESILRRVHVAFIMELPLYHQPNARTIGPSVWQRTTSFVRKASSILTASILVWALSALRGGRFGSTTWRPSGGS